MGRAGYIVPADPQVALKKKTAASRSWIFIDCSGQGTVMDVDKYAIMHRVQIHARDLRILDPLLSYPSTILGRERAIVLNLEVWCFFVVSVCVWLPRKLRKGKGIEFLFHAVNFVYKSIKKFYLSQVGKNAVSLLLFCLLNFHGTKRSFEFRSVINYSLFSNLSWF